MNQEQLVDVINKAISPRFKAVISDIPDAYVNVSRNTTKSTKCICIESGDDTYLDWYYNEFNINKVKNDMERILSTRDRDMDPITAGEFSYIAQKTMSVLK